MDQFKTFTFQSLPCNAANIQTFRESRQETPFETAALVLAALCQYEEDAKEALAMIDYLKGPQPLHTSDEEFLRDMLSGRGYIPRSFFEGATPENGYIPVEPFTVTIYAQPDSYEEAGFALLYIRSSGASGYRALKLRRKGDRWFLWEMLDILLPITEPEEDLWN